MKAAVGERILIHSKSVGAVDRHGEIVEVRGHNGEPPYLVRFDDGHESLVFPGTDSEIQAGS